MAWKNGEIPYDIVSVVLASGTDSNGYWEFRCTPTFAACWAFAKRYAEEHFGRTIYIRSGWNIYRPLFSQKIARNNACNQGNCLGAAYPGSSSHGGEWRGRPCLAVDVDPNGLTWAQVDEAMEAAGFEAGLITEQISGIKGGEPWHYILFIAFGPIPASLNASPLITPTPEEDPDMIIINVKLFDGTTHVCGLGNGLFTHFMPEDLVGIHRDMIRQPREYAFDITALPSLLRKYGCDTAIWDFRDSKFVVLDPLTGQATQGGTWSAEKATRAAIAGIKPQPLDLAPILAKIVETIKANPVNADVDELAIATAVLKGLPANPTAAQIAKAVNDDAAKRLQS